MTTPDAQTLMYLDAQGIEHPATDYLAIGAGDAPCSRYGTRSDAHTPYILACARILSDVTGEALSTDHLDGVASLVVNDSVEPSYMLAAHGTREDWELVRALDVYAIEDLRDCMLDNGYDSETLDTILGPVPAQDDD